MRNIFNFIWKNNFFFLFLLFEVFSFTLIVQHNAYQRSSFINSTNNFALTLSEKVKGITEYFHLADVNKQLAEENARLRTFNPASYKITNQKIFTVNDSIFTQEFTYIEAKVVNNSVNRRKNYLTLNKGYAHGLRKDMGVIGPDGVVGIITDVSNNYATVMSVLHIDSKISSKLKKSSQMGSLIWEGTNYRRAKLADIPTHVELEKGDTVYTSGFSSIFPEGIAVGNIVNFELRDGSMFYDIDLKLAVDFNKLSYVYVINNIFKGEQMYLENRREND